MGKYEEAVRMGKVEGILGIENEGFSPGETLWGFFFSPLVLLPTTLSISFASYLSISLSRSLWSRVEVERMYDRGERTTWSCHSTSPFPLMLQLMKQYPLYFLPCWEVPREGELRRADFPSPPLHTILSTSPQSHHLPPLSLSLSVFAVMQVKQGVSTQGFQYHIMPERMRWWTAFQKTNETQLDAGVWVSCWLWNWRR